METSRRIMPPFDLSLKTLALFALLAFGLTVFAQNGDQWYGGYSAGFWGLSDSVGVRGALPGMFNPPGSNLESPSAQRQYGGYRITDAFAIEGAQTNFGPSAFACSGDSLAGDASRSCYGAAWSLSGVATMPFQSGLSLYGRLGLHYRQKGFQEDATSIRQGNSEFMELILLVTASEAQDEPSAAQLVGHADVLHQTDWIIQRRDYDSRPQTNLFRLRGHEDAHSERIGAKAIIREVVLSEPRDVEADLLGKFHVFRGVGDDLANGLRAVTLCHQIEETEVHHLSFR